MKPLFIDIETEGLHNPQKIWCCVTKEPNQEPRVWTNLHEDSRAFNSFISSNNYTLIGHNIIGFDLPVLHAVVGLSKYYHQCIDTLVVSRLIDHWHYSSHGLDAWGTRLGYPKLPFKDFSKLTDDMITYCIRDVEITERLFNLYQKYIVDPSWAKALRLEHDTAYFCHQMRENGFGFNHEEAINLQTRIQKELSELDVSIQKAFPSKTRIIKTVTPILTKLGKINTKDFRWLKDQTPEEAGYQAGVSFDLTEEEPFNPGSPKQCIERMWEFGWKPTEKTKGHLKAERDRDWEKLKEYRINGWTISEENLNTLPESAPKEAHSLVRWILLTRRISTIQEWLNAYNPITKSIHGTIHSIGTWPHRASHSNPNQGNIPRVMAADGNPTPFGGEMRQLWGARNGRKLIGVDAEGIQLRVLAHYMQDEEFTKALVSGSKDNGTDVHTLNQHKLGRNICKSRDAAKTFIYAWLLGASAVKTASILECSLEDAVVARSNFLDGYPGLKTVKEEIIPTDAKNGYFVGFDGRKVLCDSKHKMLAGYLQNGEAIVMKYAKRLWYQKLTKEKVPFWLVDWVHDEWQTETIDDLETAEYIKQVQMNAIVQTGLDLSLKCPLSASGVIGLNWKETH